MGQLSEALGSFAGQLTETAIKGIKIEFEGNVGQLNTKPMVAAAINGVLKPSLGDINMVSAPQIAKDRGITVEVTNRDQQGAYEGYVRLTVITERQERAVAGTLFANGKSRVIQVKGINMEAELTPSMLYVTKRGQARPYRPPRHSPGQTRHQHRQLQPRPRRSRRRRHRAALHRRYRLPPSSRKSPRSRASSRRKR